MIWNKVLILDKKRSNDRLDSVEEIIDILLIIGVHMLKDKLPLSFDGTIQFYKKNFRYSSNLCSIIEI